MSRVGFFDTFEAQRLVEASSFGFECAHANTVEPCSSETETRLHKLSSDSLAAGFGDDIEMM